MAVVERLVLAEVALVPDVVRVDDRVQDQAAHALRVQLGVDRAEVGAVGVAEVVDLPGAQRPADHVEVLRGADGVHVRQHVAVLLAAGPGEGLRPVAVDPLRAGGVRHRVGAHRIEVSGQAVQGRGALSDAARVEADHVVLGGDLLRQRGRQEPGHRQTAAAGAARVDQQRALEGLRGVRDAGQSERDLTARRAAVVQRCADLRALERRVAVGRTVGPLRLRGGRRARRGGCGRRGRGGQQTCHGRTDGDQNSCTFRHGASRGDGARRGITGPRRMLPEYPRRRPCSARSRPVRSRHRPCGRSPTAAGLTAESVGWGPAPVRWPAPDPGGSAGSRPGAPGRSRTRPPARAPDA